MNESRQIQYPEPITTVTDVQMNRIVSGGAEIPTEPVNAEGYSRLVVCCGAISCGCGSASMPVPFKRTLVNPGVLIPLPDVEWVCHVGYVVDGHTHCQIGTNKNLSL